MYEPPNHTGPGGPRFQLFGNCVGRAGDINHDGYSDVFVGAYFADHGDKDEGMLFVYCGSAHGLNTNVSWWAEGNQSLSQFGVSASGGRDLNGDGFDDLIVGAQKATHTELSEGAAAIFYGSARGFKKYLDWSVEGRQNFADFGS